MLSLTGNPSPMPLSGDHGSAAGSYLNALRANVPLVVAIVALTLASAVVGMAQRETRYEATADILLTPLPQGDQTYLGLQLLRESNDPTRTAQTAAALIDSPQAAQRTAARLGPRFTPSRVQENVEVEPKGQSNIVSVTATAADPALAARLANTFVDAALQARVDALREQAKQVIATLPRNTPETRQRIAQLESLAAGSDPTMSLSQVAQPPTEPEGRQEWLVILLAGIAGFAIASGAALLAEFANRRMRDEHEIVGAFPLPVLARVPKLRRTQRADGAARALARIAGRRRRKRGSGAAALSPTPGVREAFRSLQLQLDENRLDGGATGSRVLMVTSATKDDGKTSCAIGLALAFVNAGHSVLLIDFDVRKPDVGRRLGLVNRTGLTTLINSDEPLHVKDLVESPPQVPDLQVLLAGVDKDDALLGVRFARRLPVILDQARELADYVILDTPPLGEVSDALRLIPYADDLLVVGRPGRTRSDDLELTRQLIERARIDPRGFVIVGAGKHSNYSYGS